VLTDPLVDGLAMTAPCDGPVLQVIAVQGNVSALLRELSRADDRGELGDGGRAADEAVNAYVGRYPGAARGEARPGEPDMRELPGSPPGSVQD
jgi:hypothetical protein